VKPRIRIVGGIQVEVPHPESPLDRARRIYGRPFGRENWPTGSGPRYWTTDRIAQLSAQNEERRLNRRNRK